MRPAGTARSTASAAPRCRRSGGRPRPGSRRPGAPAAGGGCGRRSRGSGRRTGPSALIIGRPVPRLDPVRSTPPAVAGASAALSGRSATIERVFVLGIDPGLSRCGYCVLEVRPSARSATSRAVAIGVMRTSPDAAVPERLAELQRDLRGPARRVPPRGGGHRAGALPGQRAHRHVGRPGQRRGHGRGRRRGLQVVEYSPNQVKQAVAGYGAADKEQVQQMVQTLLGLAAPPRPADAADAAALALCHLAFERGSLAAAGRAVAGQAVAGQAVAGRPAPDGAPDDRLAAGHAARPLRRRGARRGRRRRLPRHGHPGHRRRARRGRRRGVRCRSTTTAAKTPRRSTASRRRRAACLRGADRRPRRRPGAGAGDPVGARAARSASRARRRRRRRAVPGAGRRQEDRGPAARRAQDPPRPYPRAMRPPRRSRRSAGSSAPSVRADVRDALAGLGYGPTRSAPSCPSCRESGDAAELLRLALQKLATAS